MKIPERILGMPRKVAIPVIGGALLLVILFFWMRGRSPAPAGDLAPEAFPPPGGGGGGGFGPAYDPAADIGLAQANLALDQQRQRGLMEQQLGELEIDRQRAQLEVFQSGAALEDQFQRALLPFQIGVAREEATLQKEALHTQNIAEKRLGLQAAKAPVKCPPGMHPANVPGVGFTCRPLGDPGGGRGFNPIRQIGQVFSGFLTGAAAAAPGIGAGAVQAYAGRQGVLTVPQRRSGGQQAVSTPPINPRAGQPSLSSPSESVFDVRYPGTNVAGAYGLPGFPVRTTGAIG